MLERAPSHALSDPTLTRRVLRTGARFLALATLVFCVGAPGTASAQLKRSKKDQGVPKPPPGAQEEAPKREGAASFKVETAIDKKAVERGRAADAKRDEAIDELKKLIPKAPASRKSEMIFRLAELYWEKSKYKYSLEMEEFEKAYTEWNEAGAQGEPPQRKPFLRESELIKDNALRLYEKVLTEYPTYERNDEVLFYLGYNEYEAGNFKKAVTHYWTLIKQFPKSGLVSQAYLQLGEHFFNNNNVGKARKAYERALGGPDVANYARYKLAWCDYNVEEYAAGIVKLKTVITESEAEATTKATQLKSEALRDLARFFSYVDEVDSAFAYFNQKGGEDIAQRYTAQLGGLYHTQGKWDLEIATYRLLIDKFPRNERAPYYQASVVEAFGKKGDKPAVRKEVERLVDLYRPGTPWYKAQQDRGEAGTAALEYAYDLTESKLRDMVTEYHRDAQKRKDVNTYELARDIYAKYLDAFPGTDSAYQMRYFYAEVLWALDEWANAADQYKTVALTEKSEKASGKFAREAAYNQILAWEKVSKTGKEKGDPRTKKKITEKKKKGTTDARTSTRIKLAGLQAGKEYKETALTDLEANLSGACDLYFKIADRKDPDLPAIKFKAAYLYYKHNQFLEASKRYFEIIEEWPRDKLSKKAANLILDSLNVKKEWDALAKYAAAFRDNSQLVGKDKAFKTEVQELLEGATYLSIQEAEVDARKLAEAEEKERALAPVAVRFEKFQNDFPQSRFADKALFSAVLIYNQADELDHAIAAAERMQSVYGEKEEQPKSKKKLRKRRRKPAKKVADKKKDEKEDESSRPALLRRNHLLRASFYERIADFDQAAKLYESYYAKYPDRKESSDALFNSAVYYQGLGQTDVAIAKFTSYIDKYNKSDEADVYWRICDLHEYKKDWKATGKCFDDYRKRFKTADKAKVFESRYRYALALEEVGKKRDAVKEYEWLMREYPRLKKEEQQAPGAQLAGAHAAFELLEPEYQSYSALKVTLKRKALLKKLNTANDLACVDDKVCKTKGKYLSILTYGNGDYGICALTRMGQVFRNAADSIRKAPIPRRLTMDQREIYRAEIDTLALGPEEKGIEAFERALDKAYELNIYNECTLTAQSNLKELNPDAFPTLQKRGFQGAESFQVAGLRSDITIAEAPAPAPSPEPGAETAAEVSREAETAAGASE